MNIFGLKLYTAKQLDAMVAELTPTTEEEVDDPRMLESAKFARVYNRGTAKEMLTTIRKNSKDAELNSQIALYLSIPHQMGFLLGLVPIVFSSLVGILGSITLIGMAVGLPYLCDRLILMCIRIISTRVVSTTDKVWASVVLAPAIGISIFLNVMAPGPDLLKWVCGAVVVMVPLYQIVRSCRPNFAKAGADETAIRKQIEDLVVEEAPVEQKTRSSRAKAKEEQRAKNSERGKKAWVTRQRNAQIAAEKARLEAEAAAAAAAATVRKPRARKSTKATVADLEAQFALPDAPVSPATV